MQEPGRYWSHIPPTALAPYGPSLQRYRWLVGSGIFLATLIVGLTLLCGLALITLLTLSWSPAPAQKRPAAVPTIVFVVVPGRSTPASNEAVGLPPVAQMAPMLALRTIIPHSSPPQFEEDEGARAGDVNSPIRVVTYKQMFQEIGAHYDLDWRLLAAQAYRESALNPLAIGSSNDMGLMQILPTTWDEWAPQVGRQDPFDAYSNTQVGAAYLAYLHRTMADLGHPELCWALVAYNWGPDNVRKLLANGGDWYQIPVRQRQYATDVLEAAFGSSAGTGTTALP